MSKEILANEIVKVTEAGFDKYLAKSIIYSPFRIFYRLFKNANPRVMKYIRKTVGNDINQILGTIDNFNSNHFIQDGKMTKNGQKLRKNCHEIGINILKKKLKITNIFRIIREANFRDQIYHEVLKDIGKAVENLSLKALDAD